MKPCPFRNGNPGFTLIEILIALAVSGILILSLTRLYSTTLRSYSLQEQMTEMNQNAKFVMRELTDVLAQAGADCMAMNGDTTNKDTIITCNNASGFSIKVNPRGGLYVIASRTNKTGTCCTLSVDNAYPFRMADRIGHIPSPATSLQRTVNSYQLIGYDTNTKKIFLSGGSTPDSFLVNDFIYSYSLNHYYLSGTNLCLNNDTNVLAENIDSLCISFKTKTGDTTTNWQTMSFVSLAIRARTSQTDNRYKSDHNDHYRRITFTNIFRMKNKVN